jgi:hypothetical protein
MMMLDLYSMTVSRKNGFGILRSLEEWCTILLDMDGRMGGWVRGCWEGDVWDGILNSWGWRAGYSRIYCCI